MKKAIILLTAVFFSFVSIGQKTNDNGSTGGNAKNNNNPPTNNNTNNDTNGGSGVILDITETIFGIYQQNLVRKRGNDSFVFGFEAGIDAGVLSSSDDSYFAVNPKIKYNRGAVSFEGRYDYLNGNTDMQNIDVLAEFNIVIKNFKTALGQGFMYDIENGIGFHESYIGMFAGFSDKKIIVSPEFRLAYDWTVHKPVNSELTLKLFYRLAGTSKLSLYVNGGAGLRYLRDYGSFADVSGGLYLVF